MDQLIHQFKTHVMTAAQNQNFLHHKWYTKYHLEIVEKISLELCAKHGEADKNMVLLLVWLHDYGKILNFNNQYQETITSGKEKLLELGFPEDFVEKAIKFVELFDGKENLNEAPMEVQIVSSADGAAHLVGPFFQIWWHENANKDFQDLMNDVVYKAKLDWDKKVVLPEVRENFQTRHNFLLEQSGQLPERFLK